MVNEEEETPAGALRRRGESRVSSITFCGFVASCEPLELHFRLEDKHERMISHPADPGDCKFSECD